MEADPLLALISLEEHISPMNRRDEEIQFEEAWLIWVDAQKYKAPN